MDIVSWDNYPPRGADPAGIAFQHDLMRGLKEGQPFMLMEQTPSQQNWQPYNALKRPGVMRLWSYQAMAHGADTVMYFQWRRSRGAQEKYHGAVVEHVGTSDAARVPGSGASLGRELEALGTRTLGGRVPAQVALLFDWDNWWAVEYSSGPSVDLKYVAAGRRLAQGAAHAGHSRWTSSRRRPTCRPTNWSSRPCCTWSSRASPRSWKRSPVRAARS